MEGMEGGRDGGQVRKVGWSVFVGGDRGREGRRGRGVMDLALRNGLRPHWRGERGTVRRKDEQRVRLETFFFFFFFHCTIFSKVGIRGRRRRREKYSCVFQSRGKFSKFVFFFLFTSRQLGERVGVCMIFAFLSIKFLWFCCFLLFYFFFFFWLVKTVV